VPAPAVDQVLARLQQAVAASMEGMTLRDLAARDATPPHEGRIEPSA
jgi:hypothetical protein